MSLDKSWGAGTSDILRKTCDIVQSIGDQGLTTMFVYLSTWAATQSGLFPAYESHCTFKCAHSWMQALLWQLSIIIQANTHCGKNLTSSKLSCTLNVQNPTHPAMGNTILHYMHKTLRIIPFDASLHLKKDVASSQEGISSSHQVRTQHTYE